MESAYNREMYKGGPCKRKKKPNPLTAQEEYCEHVHQEWCEGKPVTDEHQCGYPSDHKHHRS